MGNQVEEMLRNNLQLGFVYMVCYRSGGCASTHFDLELALARAESLQGVVSAVPIIRDFRTDLG